MNDHDTLNLLTSAPACGISGGLVGTTLERWLQMKSTQSLIAIWTTSKRDSDDEIR